MLFAIHSRLSAPNPAILPAIVLVHVDWNDWFEFETTFSVYFYDDSGRRTPLGSTKIGQVGLTDAQRKPDLPQEFESLDERFFSLGQDENFYEAIFDLGEDLRRQIFNGLRDCAYNLDIFRARRHERVMQISLLRQVQPDTVINRFNRIAHGNAELTPFSFEYQFPHTETDLSPTPTLTFEVSPNSSPPTNIHVLIGRNGVGKTRCLNYLAHALLGVSPTGGGHAGHVINQGQSGFANLVSVSFSAFDPFEPLEEGTPFDSKIRYAYIGLKKTDPDLPYASTSYPDRTPRPLKTHSELADDFVSSVERCRSGPRSERWRAAIRTLESDPLFHEADVSSLADVDDNYNWQPRADVLFKTLSSGHGIVLLTLTRLVELVDEATLVLLDEPESHLHPPLLSSFIRALSDLLIKRNGVAIVATHSPVVLQEVPKSCVWVLNRSGESRRAERPEAETFAENVGVLTREIFGLEVAQSGFHRLIETAIQEVGDDYEDVLEYFGAQMGAEGRAIARALVSFAKRRTGR